MVYIHQSTDAQKLNGIVIDRHIYKYQYQTYVESEDGVVAWFDIFMDIDEETNGID